MRKAIATGLLAPLALCFEFEVADARTSSSSMRRPPSISAARTAARGSHLSTGYTINQINMYMLGVAFKASIENRKFLGRASDLKECMGEPDFLEYLSRKGLLDDIDSSVSLVKYNIPITGKKSEDLSAKYNDCIDGINETEVKKSILPLSVCGLSLLGSGLLIWRSRRERRLVEHCL
ncbi:MAG: hypothetical protein HRT94_09630 [Alphaproteobacteria bacterium]|nr:hypothetical protein [Alphaproteobacteria bacterium]